MRRSYEDQGAALECLRLAQQATAHQGWEFVIRRAERYYAFVTGKDAEDIMERLRAALRD